MITKNTKVGAGHPQNVLVNLTKSDVSAEKSDDDLAFYGIFGANQTGRGA